MIADLDRATFSNIEQQSLEFVMHTMTPWAERWEASITSELLLESDDLEVEFNFANLMRGDAASRSAYYQSGIQNGWLTRNEARVAENLNPLDGLDEPLRPLNMVEEHAAQDVDEPEEPESAETEAPDIGRLDALITSTANRWARRLAKTKQLDANAKELLSDAFALPMTRIEQWAEQIQLANLTEQELSRSLIELGKNHEPTATRR
jgi:hypothetical protein